MTNRKISMSIVAIICFSNLIGVNIGMASIQNVKGIIKENSVFVLNVDPGFEETYLEWAPTNQNGFIEYRIYRGTTPNNEILLDTIDNNATTTYTDTNVTVGIEYFYNVTYAFDGFSVWGDDSPLTNSTIPGKSLSAISQLNFTQSSESYFLNWSAPEEDANYPTQGFNIYVGITAESLSLNGTTLATETQYNLTNIDTTLNYYIKISTYNEIGESILSELFTIEALENGDDNEDNNDDDPSNLLLTLGLPAIGIGIFAVAFIYLKKK